MIEHATDLRPRRPGLVALALLVSLVATACSSDAEAGAEQEAFERVINVEIVELTPTDFTERIRMTGTVQANQDVEISAEESGVVREILVEKGAVVSEGDPLLRIDGRILSAQLREAEARAELARETWERRKRLFEEDRVGSELAYLEARYGWEQADAALSNLRERLDRAVVRAPLSGVLEDRYVEIGTSVASGTPVARIVQVNPVKISAGVPERFAGDVRRGVEARVHFDALGGEAHRAPITYVGSTVDPGNRTFAIEVVLANPARLFKPEMVANVEVSRREFEGVVVVPQDAIVRTEEGFVAFVVAEGSEGTAAEVRPLTLGPTQGNRAVVEEGLDFGDRLIVVGQQRVSDRDRVRVVGGDS